MILSLSFCLVFLAIGMFPRKAIPETILDCFLGTD